MRFVIDILNLKKQDHFLIKIRVYL